MNRIKRRSLGFTLIELVVVISILGILAAIAVPRFIDIRTQAYTAQRDGIVGSLRAGIMLVASKNQVQATPDSDTFPDDLEATWGGTTGGTQPGAGDFPSSCSTGMGSPCFELVLTQPLSDGNWSQESANTYKFDAPVGTDVTYTYTQATGRFE